MDRFNVFLASKPMLQEERNYDERNTIVYYSWEEGKNPKGAWGVVAFSFLPCFFAFVAYASTAYNAHTHTHSFHPSLAEFGYSLPRVTVEYDRATGFMLSISIEYNRRQAKRNQALTGAEVRNKVCENMLAAGIFEDKAFTFKEAVVFAKAEDLKGGDNA
jgi:hypothetical protein